MKARPAALTERQLASPSQTQAPDIQIRH
jgi:hypothetical protein